MIVSQKQGWIRLHRSTMNSSVWKNPVVWMVWCWCLLRSNHKKSTFPFNGSDIDILPGQFISGRDSAIKELGTLTPQQWRTAIKYLKSTNRITIKSTNKFSLFTVIKWYEYQTDNQQSNQPLTNEQPTTNQPLTTDKNDNNDKNEEKESVEDSATLSEKNLKPKPNSPRGWANLRRSEIGKPPIRTPRSEKQVETFEALKWKDYFRDQGYAQHGMQFFKVESKKRESAVSKLIIEANKNVEDIKGLIDWWFEGNGEWAQYEPEQCFMGKTIERFINRNKGTKQNKPLSL